MNLRKQRIAFEAPYLALLREQLSQHIDRLWQQNFTHLAPSFALLKYRHKFLMELRELIFLQILAKRGRDTAEAICPSKDTLRRMLSEDHDASFYEGPKQAVSIFIGYRSWEEFLRKHADNSSPTTALFVRESDGKHRKPSGKTAATKPSTRRPRKG